MSVWLTPSPSQLRLDPASRPCTPRKSSRLCISQKAGRPFQPLRAQQHFRPQRHAQRQPVGSLSHRASPETKPSQCLLRVTQAAPPHFSLSPALAPSLFTPTVNPQPPTVRQPLKPMTSQSPVATVETDSEGRNHSHGDDVSDPQAKVLRIRSIVAIAKKLFSEWLGTLLLIALVIGSGIMGELLASGNVAISLLANTLATVWGLYILIEVFGPISGAHFNPVVSTVMVIRGALPKKLLIPYIVLQLFGAICGAWLANIMFGQPIIEFSTKIRPGITQWVSEVVATFGLLLVILRGPSGKVSSMVGAYIGSAYWFTASTSFANPAAVVGRMFSNTFAGIAPQSAPGFIIAEIIGGTLATVVNWILEYEGPREIKAVVVEDVGSSRDLENGQGHTSGPL